MSLGRDLSCVTDLDPTMLEVSELDCLVAGLARRLGTSAGQLIDAPLYGFNLRELLHAGMTAAEVASIPSRVRAELMKDERVLDVAVQGTLAGGRLTLTIAGSAAPGPFRFTLIVSDVTVDLIRGGA